MSDKPTELRGGWWAKNLDDIDREVARLATICNVRILDPGVIERVLENDASVCGSSNPIAFGKLRNALMMHYHIREKAVGALGEAGTARVIADIVENLRQRIDARLGTPPTPRSARSCSGTRSASAATISSSARGRACPLCCISTTKRSSTAASLHGRSTTRWSESFPPRV